MNLITDAFTDASAIQLDAIGFDWSPVMTADDKWDAALDDVRRFREEHGRRAARFSDGAVAALMQAPWPGNVRQLENVIERAVVLSSGDIIDRGDLPAALTAAAGPEPLPSADAALPDGPPLPLKQAMIAPEKRIIEQALAWCDGNRERAAEVLGINRSTLFHKLKKLGIR